MRETTRFENCYIQLILCTYALQGLLTSKYKYYKPHEIDDTTKLDEALRGHDSRSKVNVLCRLE